MSNKKTRQLSAAKRILQAMQLERESMVHLQSQEYGLIAPSDNYLRLSAEYRAIMESLGEFQVVESVF